MSLKSSESMMGVHGNGHTTYPNFIGPSRAVASYTRVKAHILHEEIKGIEFVHILEIRR